MDYPACGICSAVVLDMRKHRRWHDDQERKTEEAIARALRDMGRQADLIRRAG